MSKSGLSLLLASLVWISCITVNVNFPEGAVQKAADDYVRELYRAKQEKDSVGKGEIKPEVKPGAFNEIFVLVQDAVAADVVINVKTPKAKEIQSRLATRLDEVLAAKRSGVLGESQDGMLVIKDSASLKPIQRKKMESLVNSENADRNLLYSEVVQSNSLATTRTMDVQKSFSRSFQSESPSGTWVESESGTWSKKP